jgi:hypothetical protein
MHAVMNRLMERDYNRVSSRDDMVTAAQQFVGEHFYDRTLTQIDVVECIIPAIDTLYELMDIYGGHFRVEAREMRVRFPSVPGAFGTADLLLGSDTHILLIDWKFGAGVPVKAVYGDSKGDYVNPQLMFYFAGAMSTMPKLFTKRRFAVAIIQPRVVESLTHTAITRTEVKYFVEDVDNAIVAALARNPVLNPGDHCRWCPARPVCPKHTEALFELTEFGAAPVPPRPIPADSDNGEYGEFLAKAKRLADMAADYKRAVDEQLHAYLDGGGTVPGWRLKLKPKLRQWVDADEVNNELTRLGFGQDEIWQRKLQTFAVADKVAKRLKVKIPDHLRVAPESTETVLATTDDPAPIVDRAAAALEFQLALAQLRDEAS